MGGNHIWLPGEEATAATMNTYVGRQVVCHFHDAADRNTQLFDPQVGQVCTLDSHPGAVYAWTGADWVEPAPYTQWGNTLITTDSNGNGHLAYPTPFAGHENAVQLTCGGGSAATGGAVLVAQVIESQNLSTLVNFKVRSLPTGAAYVGVVRVLWTVTGVRPAT